MGLMKEESMRQIVVAGRFGRYYKDRTEIVGKTDMSEFTLHDLQCFDAVVRAGGFQAAATLLHRSHPAVFAAVAKLERQLGLALLDRAGYRVKPTPAGQSFHLRAQALLRELAGLRAHAEQLAMGQETELNVVIGDFCPRPLLLGMLGQFFAAWPATLRRTGPACPAARVAGKSRRSPRSIRFPGPSPTARHGPAGRPVHAAGPARAGETTARPAWA